VDKSRTLGKSFLVIMQNRSFLRLLSNFLVPIVMNILQIDVEHFYCDYHIDVGKWENVKELDSHRDRTIHSTQKILNILEEKRTTATFFILGCVAKRYPDLIEKVAEDHEVASHGYWHVLATRQSPQEFEVDLVDSLEVLNKLSQQRVIGYRTCNFTLVEKTSWIIDVLKRHGFKYDSSIFPIKTHLYGVPDAPLFPYHISSSNIKVDSSDESLWEFPLSAYKIPFANKNVPIAGGVYFRLLPYWFIKRCIKNLNRRGRPAIFYIHTWELDPFQPRIGSLGWYHYHGLASAEKKFIKLIKDFDFTSTKEWIEKC
jgi:polysaccharide deacetylase family protein (PEP-CTERM system associated)